MVHPIRFRIKRKRSRSISDDANEIAARTPLKFKICERIVMRLLDLVVHPSR